LAKDFDNFFSTLENLPPHAGMDPAVGQAGLQPPTSRNPMEPRLSLPYKFEEEESGKEKLKERRRRREKPLSELILDPPLSTRYTHTHSARHRRFSRWEARREGEAKNK
jgi:hypothetical protein